MTNSKGIFDTGNTADQDYDNPGEAFVESESSLLETLVGEGKKFKDPEALAKGKVLSDAFIERLKEENLEARRELERLRNERASNTKIEEFMNELRRSPNPMSNGNNQSTENREEMNDSVALNTDVITEQVLTALEQRNRVATERENVTKVALALKESFGSEWQKRLKDYANSVGMDEDTVDIWVKKNPTAVISQVQNAFKAPVPSPNLPNSLNSASLPTDTNGVRNKAYYDKIKAKDNKYFWSSEVQIQMHRDAQKLKEKFFA